MQAGGHALVVYPPHERLGHPEANERICWPAILAVLAVQMIVSITLSIAVANHSSFGKASSTDLKAEALKR
jgi:hypothetical protein